MQIAQAEGAIADPDQAVHIQIQRVQRAADFAVELATSRSVAEDWPDVDQLGAIILDLGLPDGDGGELISQLQREHPQTVVVVATIHDDDEHVFPALRAGASGYILKSQPADVVKAQLRCIELDAPALSPSIAARVLRHFRSDGPSGVSTVAQTPLVQLTDREVDVLRLIAKGSKASEVAQLLTLSSHTVTGYVRDIYRKLGISSRAEATLEAARRGLVT